MLRLFNHQEKNSPGRNQSGLTMIELLIVIAIMGILSATFYVKVNISSRQQVEQSTQELLSNLRQMRNMVVSKTVHKFVNDEVVYPAGGYGLAFDGTAVPAKYFLYADKDGTAGYLAGQDEKIGSDIILPSTFSIINKVDQDKLFYFALLSEKQAVSDLAVGTDKRFVITLRWPGPGGRQKGYDANIGLGEQNSDGSILANFGTFYEDYTPPPLPPPSGCGLDCPILGDF